MNFYRKLKEFFFKITGLLSIIFLFFILIYILYSIILNSYKAFYIHEIKVSIPLTQETLSEIHLNPDTITDILKNHLRKIFNSKNLEITDILSSNYTDNLIQLSQTSLKELKNSTYTANFLLNNNIEQYLKNNILPQDISPSILPIINNLKNQNIISSSFNFFFFLNNDSSYSELAGIKSAFIGSISSILISLIFSFIIGVGTAIYLEEFSSKNFIYSFIEININNLAAVPSIIYGLLGITILQNFFLIPRGSILLAGILLGIISLPTIIINTRLSLRAIPYYIKESGYGIGASKHQIIFNLILPLALPNIFTGTVLAMLRALGETAPLLLLGMFIFNTQTPNSILDKSTSLPVQILLWYNIPSAGFLEKASATILILILLVIIISAITMYLKKKFEKNF